MDAEVLVDVRHLAAPEPLRKVLDVLQDLRDGQFAHVLHRREANCLCQLIDSMGFEHRTEGDPQSGYDIWIWRGNDALAALAAREAQGH